MLLHPYAPNLPSSWCLPDVLCAIKSSVEMADKGVIQVTIKDKDEFCSNLLIQLRRIIFVKQIECHLQIVQI